MGPKRTAAILHGAAIDRPDEADTIVQAETVSRMLGRLGWTSEIVAVGLDLAVLDRLRRRRPDMVFNLVEALDGDGRLAHVVPAALEHLGIPFTGSSARAIFATTDKPLSKTLLRGAGLPTPDWSASGYRRELGADCHRVIVKSVCEDASIGIDARSVVPSSRASAEIAHRSRRFGGAWFAEAFIDGREFNVGVLDGENGPEVLPIAEIRFVDYPADRPKIVDYEAKWLEGSFAFDHTPRSFEFAADDEPLLEDLRRLALAAVELFGVTGYGRVDFRVDAAGRPWILEVNANPCLAPDAGFAAAAAQADLSLADIVGRIVESADRREARAAA